MKDKVWKQNGAQGGYLLVSLFRATQWKGKKLEGYIHQSFPMMFGLNTYESLI